MRALPSALRGRRRSRGGYDHDDGRESSRLAARSRIRIPGRSSPGPILDRDARRKCHGFVAKTTDLEHVRRRFSEDLIAALLQHCPVIGHQFRIGCRRAKNVVPLRAACVVRRNELRRGINREPQRGFCGRLGTGGLCSWRGWCRWCGWCRRRSLCRRGAWRRRLRCGNSGWLGGLGRWKRSRGLRERARRDENNQTQHFPGHEAIIGRR